MIEPTRSLPFGLTSRGARGQGTTIVSLVGPENAPNSDVFGHNRTRPYGMKTLAVISILALLTISGAAYTDQLLTSEQHTMQRVD
jgi:hypothetical protein